MIQHLDIRTVQRTDSQRPLSANFMLLVPEASVPASEIVQTDRPPE